MCIQLFLPIIAAAFLSSCLFADNSLMEEVSRQKTIFSLPALPYPYDSLEPYMDTRTMQIHHDRHHKAYVENLNKAIKGSAWEGMTLEQLFAKANELPVAIRNNAAGHWTHSFFWSILQPANPHNPMGAALQKELEQAFGSVDAFKAQFKKAGLERFGSGWVWLIKHPDGKLQVLSSPNDDTTLMDFAVVHGKPLLACDVWEHAYYLKYTNHRDEFLDGFWNVVNWKRVEELSQSPTG